MLNLKKKKNNKELRMKNKEKGGVTYRCRNWGLWWRAEGGLLVVCEQRGRDWQKSHLCDYVSYPEQVEQWG